MRPPPALIALLAAAPAAAQNRPPQPTHVPIEFVEMLSMSPMSARPTVMLGTLPEPLMRILRPGSGARILGTMDYRLFSMSAVIVPGGQRAVREQWTERLRQAGWMPAPTPPTYMHEGGFHARGDERPDDRIADRWCAPDDDAVINLHASARGADSTGVTIMYGSGRMTGECSPDPRLTQMREFAPMPTLTAPESGMQRRAGTSSGMNEASSTAQVSSDLSLAQLLTHYASEMQSAGWSGGAASLGTDIAAQTFRFTDEDGVEWRGTLTATTISSRDAEVHLRIARVRE